MDAHSYMHSKVQIKGTGGTFSDIDTHVCTVTSFITLLLQNS